MRFGIDCCWTRLHKAIQFGVFTGFVFAGPVFDKYNNSYDNESYRHFAIVLVVSRTCIAVQYVVVTWQGRMFRQTLLPLALSTLVYVAAAVAYAITFVVFPHAAVGLSEQIAWYVRICLPEVSLLTRTDRVVIAIVEGLAVLLIAMTWRIVSFKYTHIVERLQLLTLIIIGEGIIGMIKSVACITKGQAENNSTELGSVVAAVVLLVSSHRSRFRRNTNMRSILSTCFTSTSSPKIDSAHCASRSGRCYTIHCTWPLSSVLRAILP